MRRAAGPDRRFVAPIGATDRCQLAVAAFRVLLDRHPYAGRPTERMDRLHGKLMALVTQFTAAERAYFDDQVGLLAHREPNWRIRMSETPEQLPTDPSDRPSRPPVDPHPGRPDRPEVDPHPGRGPEKGPKPDNTLPEPEKPGRPQPKR